MKQNEAVILTLEKLGGMATLATLYHEVLKIKECTWGTKTPFASIRRIVQNQPEIFKVRPGLWALESYRQKLGLTIEDSVPREEQLKNTHSYYQGIILQLGNLRNLQTFAPQQDKNRYFLNLKLAEIRSLDKIPKFSYDQLVNRSQTIDAIWFNQRMMPDSFFEVEHSTDIQNSLLKFVDLQDFSAKMIIVAAQARQPEFEQKISITAFAEIRSRVRFLTYEILIQQFEHESFKQSQTFVI